MKKYFKKTITANKAEKSKKNNRTSKKKNNRKSKRKYNRISKKKGGMYSAVDLRKDLADLHALSEDILKAQHDDDDYDIKELLNKSQSLMGKLFPDELERSLNKLKEYFKKDDKTKRGWDDMIYDIDEKLYTSLYSKIKESGLEEEQKEYMIVQRVRSIDLVLRLIIKNTQDDQGNLLSKKNIPDKGETTEAVFPPWDGRNQFAKQILEP